LVVTILATLLLWAIIVGGFMTGGGPLVTLAAWFVAVVVIAGVLMALIVRVQDARHNFSRRIAGPANRSRLP
jgi:flagellar motor component MotA